MRRLLPAFLLLASAAAAQEYGTDHRFKVRVGGEDRKGGFFLPNTLKEGDVVPLLVAVPDTKGKAFLELGQWKQQAAEHKFGVVSVDLITSTERGWHPSEQLDMQRDVEAVTLAIQEAEKVAREQNFMVDTSARVLTGFSGGTYVVLHMGLRRPDLFLGICARSCVFFPEIAERGKLDTVPPDYDMPIFLYRGALDHPRVSQETDQAKKTLERAGYKNVTHKIVPKMIHESKPEVFLEWFYKLLKDTAKGRKEAQKIAADVEKLRPDLASGRSGVYSKLSLLAAREKKAGFPAGAVELLQSVEAKAQARMDDANRLFEAGSVLEAAEAYKEVQKDFKGLDIAKRARALAAKVKKSDAYKAEEMYRKAMDWKEDGKEEKAADLLEKIIAKYPETPAGKRAAAAMGS